MSYINDNKFMTEFINILTTHENDAEIRICIYTDLIQYMIDADADFNFKRLRKLDNAFDKAADEFDIGEELDLEDYD